MITSNKRPLSPESTNGHLTTDQRALKRFKLHSIIQELRNEEANLVILKKLRSSQQIGTRQTTASTSNGHHSNTAARTLPPTKSAPTSTSRSANPSVVPAATRKPTVPAAPLPVALPSSKIPTMPTKSSPNVSNSTLVSSNQISLEERKAQAKNALRLKLERDLLNIPAPKPLLQDIFFVPNPNSLEFQPYIGLEDVVQCLYELQNDRHRLPQRFTDRAQVDEPYVCDQCGTDYTIRWWKHLNNSNSQTNILCDRCKKQVTRRTLKSEHSALLKSVFVSAIEQEKEIDKSFHALIKQQQKVSNSATRSSPSTMPASSKIPAVARPPATYLPPNSTLPNPSKPKAKSSVPSAQNFATKLSQQAPVNATRKSNVVPPSAPPVSHPSTMKSPMATHHSSSSSPQQQFRNATSLTAQQAKQFQMAKMPKNATRQASALPVATGATPSARANFLPTGTPLIPPTNPATALAAAAAALAGIPPSLLAASTHPTMRPTATKRRT